MSRLVRELEKQTLSIHDDYVSRMNAINNPPAKEKEVKEEPMVVFARMVFNFILRFIGVFLALWGLGHLGLYWDTYAAHPWITAFWIVVTLEGLGYAVFNYETYRFREIQKKFYEKNT